MSFLQYLNQAEWSFCLSFVWGFRILLLLLLVSLFWLCQCSPLFLFCFPFLLSLCRVSPWNFGFSCSFSPSAVPADFELGGRVEGARGPCSGAVQGGDAGWWWGSDPWSSALQEALGRQRRKRINQESCQSFLACFRGLCPSSSNWVFEHPGRASVAHLNA